MKILRSCVLLILLQSHIVLRIYAEFWKHRYYTETSGIWDGEMKFIPWDDYYHNPNQVNWGNWNVPPLLAPRINGTNYRVPDKHKTPDYRVPEPPFTAVKMNWREQNRYFRLTPEVVWRWRNDLHWKTDKPQLLNCYCVTVYKKFTPLGMGAVLSWRHMLTTAMSTDVILKRYQKKKTLENILGFWYNTDLHDITHTNSSYYATPARIVYHPLWQPVEMTNRSHPLPCVYDLALWTTTTLMYHSPFWWYSVLDGQDNKGFVPATCQRWTSYYNFKQPPRSPTWAPLEKYIIVGCQMVMDIGRRPFPWFRYAYKSQSGQISPTCPKSEWGWFICMMCKGPTMLLGAEPGAALHIMPTFVYGWAWRYHGLAGLNSFAMKLRSKMFVNYFTVLDRHSVLEFIYDAMSGNLAHNYMDKRFVTCKEKIGMCLDPKGPEINESHDNPLDYNVGPKNTAGAYRPIWW